MQQTTDINKLFSLEEYIKLDETGTIRHEFYHGKLFAMPGETLLHNEVCIRILILLTNLLKKDFFKIYIESVKVKIENEEIYLYPDIVVIEAKDLLQTNKSYIIDKPVLVAEVLSDSTRKYDSTDKFIQYQKISSLRYYLLVEPEKHVVIFYIKDDSGEWSSKPFTELTEIILLPALEAEFTLAEIYS